MVLTKSTALLRSFNLLRRNNALLINSRNSGGVWNYRASSKPKRNIIIQAEVVGAIFWWWVLWHCWTEPGHILGEFEYPDASKWTDEELGIPPEE